MQLQPVKLSHFTIAKNLRTPVLPHLSTSAQFSLDQTLLATTTTNRNSTTLNSSSHSHTTINDPKNLPNSNQNSLSKTQSFPILFTVIVYSLSTTLRRHSSTSLQLRRVRCRQTGIHILNVHSHLWCAVP